jgi:hypothetical protein
VTLAEGLAHADDERTGAAAGLAPRPLATVLERRVCAPAHVTKNALGRSLRRIGREADQEGTRLMTTFGSAEADPAVS